MVKEMIRFSKKNITSITNWRCENFLLYKFYDNFCSILNAEPVDMFPA